MLVEIRKDRSSAGKIGWLLNFQRSLFVLGSSKSKMVLKLLKTQRPTVSAQPNIVPELQKELDFMKQKEAVLAEVSIHVTL